MHCIMSPSHSITSSYSYHTHIHSPTITLTSYQISITLPPSQERERPEFVHVIKRKIKNFPEEKKKEYRIYNQVLERFEYIQPPAILWPKVATAFSVLFTMVCLCVCQLEVVHTGSFNTG